jgi:hypothetical protein
MDRGKWEIRGEVRKWTDVPLHHRGLNSMTQDRIAESGMDRPQDRDFDGWFKAT